MRMIHWADGISWLKSLLQLLTFRSWTERGLCCSRSQLLPALPVKRLRKQGVLFLLWRLFVHHRFFTTISVKIPAHAWFLSAVTTRISPACSSILEIILHLSFHTLSQKCPTGFLRREGRMLCLSLYTSELGSIIPMYIQNELIKTLSLKFPRTVS